MSVFVNKKYANHIGKKYTICISRSIESLLSNNNENNNESLLDKILKAIKKIKYI